MYTKGSETCSFNLLTYKVLTILTSKSLLVEMFYQTLHDDILKGIAESIYKVKTNKERRKHIYNLSTINMKNISCVLLMSMYLFKSNKVGWIALSVIENDKHNKVIGIVNHRIIQNVGLLSWFLRWYPHSTLSHRVFPGEDFTQVHSPVPLAIWSRVRCLS